jgi:hypothetical protein
MHISHHVATPMNDQNERMQNNQEGTIFNFDHVSRSFCQLTHPFPQFARHFTSTPARVEVDPIVMACFTIAMRTQTTAFHWVHYLASTGNFSFVKDGFAGE